MKKNSGITSTPRLLSMAATLGRFGPLTRTQVQRLTPTFEDMPSETASRGRTLRREIARLKAVRFIEERIFPGGREPVWYLTAAGEAWVLDHGLLAEARGNVVDRYFGQPFPFHSRLIKDIAVVLLLARHSPLLTPKITGFAWTEGEVWTVELPDMPGIVQDIEPDAVAWLNVEGRSKPLALAIEADSGQERGNHWLEKVMRYRAWARSAAALPNAMNMQDTVVVVVTTGDIRCRNLARVTAENLGTEGPCFLFTTRGAWTEANVWAPVFLPAGLRAYSTVGAVGLLENNGSK